MADSPAPLSQSKALLRLHLRRRRQDRAVRSIETSIEALAVLLRRELRESSACRIYRRRRRGFQHLLRREHVVYFSGAVWLAGEDRRRVAGRVLDRVGVEVRERFKSLGRDAWIVAYVPVVVERSGRPGKRWHFFFFLLLSLSLSDPTRFLRPDVSVNLRVHVFQYL